MEFIIHCVNVIFYFLVRLLLYIVDCSYSCTSANCSEMVHLVGFYTFLSKCWVSSQLMAGSTVFVIFLHRHFNRCIVFSHFASVHLLLFVPCEILSPYSKLLMTTDWTPWAPTLLPMLRLGSLVTFAFSLSLGELTYYYC